MRPSAPTKPLQRLGPNPIEARMTLRILHVLDHSIPLHSGYSFRTRALVREQRRLGWQTFHLTSGKHIHCEVDEEEVDGLHFFRTRFDSMRGQAARVPGAHEWQLMRALQGRLLGVARAVRPDIIHAHSPVLNAAPALAVGARLGIPVAYEVRAFWEDAAVDHGTTKEGSLRYRLSRGFETRALKRAAHIFTICEGLRSDIVARGVSPQAVTVIPNAVDIDAFAPGGVADVELKARLGLAEATVLGFIGSFYAYEGLDLLVGSLPALLQTHPTVKVLLVGGGPCEAALREQVALLGLAERVVFAGRVPHSAVQAHYDLIDVLVYPRHSMRLTDLVTPLKPLEAMAQGRVMVASDVGGHRELIQPGVQGTLFAAGDADALVAALHKVLTHREDWPRQRRAGRELVETQRNWARSVANYVEPYARMAQQVDSARAATGARA
jgi:PEP-CTERM/exosortase A-associated glycosyltransferase